jgi:two-component system, cell cycle response regulator DivK
MPNDLILVVEDDEKSRRLVRDLLTYNGYRILEAANGLEGVRLAQEHEPALILMDIQLPDISGIEARQRLRSAANTAGIPVMAVTASVMPDDRQRVIDAGFEVYHRKPINVKEFVAAIKDLLARRAESRGDT